MWPMLTIIVLLAVVPSTLAAQGTAAAEEEVQRVTRQYLDARVANDTAMLGRILADDFTSINSSGAIGDRSAALRAPTNVTPTGERILAFDVDSLRARVYGSTAVVIGVRRLRRADGSVSAGLRFTFVFVQRGGDWRLVASHSTDIQPPRSRGNGKNGADPAVAAPHVVNEYFPDSLELAKRRLSPSLHTEVTIWACGITGGCSCHAGNPEVPAP